jgi:hypothetical protein
LKRQHCAVIQAQVDGVGRIEAKLVELIKEFPRKEGIAAASLAIEIELWLGKCLMPPPNPDRKRRRHPWLQVNDVLAGYNDQGLDFRAFDRPADSIETLSGDRAMFGRGTFWPGGHIGEVHGGGSEHGTRPLG